MKKFNKLIFVIVCLFAFSISVFADEGKYDYTESKTTYSLDEIAELQLTQGNTAKAFSENLGACKSLEYKTTVEEGTDNLNTITAESARERDNAVEKKEEEGYTVVVVEEKHEAAVLEHAFNVLNGEIVSTTVNGNDRQGYEGRKADQVISSPEFTDYEDEEVAVQNTVTVDFHEVSGTNTFVANNQARNYEQELLSKGYRPEIIQNNTTPTVKTFRRTSLLSGFDRDLIIFGVYGANPNKEILNLDISYEEKTETATFDNQFAANYNAWQKWISGRYSSVDVEKVIDDSNPELTVNKGEIEWTSTSLAPYTEDIYDNDQDVVGYRYYYNEEIEIEPAQDEVNVPNGGNDYDSRIGSIAARTACERARNYYGDGWTTECRENTPNPFRPLHHTYTLIAHKDAVTGIQGYYDEYRYSVNYNVISKYYLYTLSYVPTDWTVNYTGDEGVVNITKSSADKFYTIDGSRPEYTVKTFGTIKEDKACLNAGKTVGTGVKENIYFEIILLLSTIGLVSLYVYKKKMN